MRKRSRSAWWWFGVEVCSWVVLVLVLASVAFGCDAQPDASVGLLLLTILVALLVRSLGSWVLRLADVAWIWAYWNGLPSSSIRSLCWGRVIAVDDSALSVDLMARAASSSPACLLRELLALVLGFLLLLDMAGEGLGAG